MKDYKDTGKKTSGRWLETLEQLPRYLGINLADFGTDIWKKTVTRVAHRQRKRRAKLNYANDNQKDNDIHWKHFWLDEIKLDLFGHRDVVSVWRKKGESYNPKNFVLIVKHGNTMEMLQCI